MSIACFLKSNNVIMGVTSMKELIIINHLRVVMPYFPIFIYFFINFPLLGLSNQVMFFCKIMAHVIECDKVSSMNYKDDGTFWYGDSCALELALG